MKSEGLGLKIISCHIPALQDEVNQFISLKSFLLICELHILTVPTSLCCCEAVLGNIWGKKL